jgi:hypothetical protein
MKTRHSEKTAHLFSHSSTRGSTGRRERTERIRPLMKSSGHSSSNSCPTTKGAFAGLTYQATKNYNACPLDIDQVS